MKATPYLNTATKSFVVFMGTILMVAHMVCLYGCGESYDTIHVQRAYTNNDNEVDHSAILKEVEPSNIEKFPSQSELFYKINNYNVYCYAPVFTVSNKKPATYVTERTTFNTNLYSRITHYFTNENLPIDMFSEESIILESGNNATCVLYPDYLSIQLGNNWLIQLEDWIIAGNAYPGEPIGTTLENIKVNEATCISIACKVLSDLQISDMVHVSSKKARIISPNNKTISEGWYLGFKREVNNIAVDFNYLTQNGVLNLETTDYTAPFQDEMIYMYITDEGVLFFRWSNPSMIKDTLTQHIELLPFEEIQTEIIGYIHEGSDNTSLTSQYIPKVQRIVLTECQIRISNQQNQGLLIPTWMIVFTCDEYIKRYQPEFAIFINAIDGSRIDPLIITNTP